MDHFASSRVAPRSALGFLPCGPFAAAALGAALMLCARPSPARADDDERRGGRDGERGGRDGEWGGRDGEWNDGERNDGEWNDGERNEIVAPQHGPSLGEFRDSLSPYGEWIDTPEYGTVWRPAVDDGWRPYFRGRWAWTVAGWYWVAEEPFGWAVYHYGRWAYLDGIGWGWLPGHRWAPAWVAWRWGDGYAGWCPLGPRGYVYSRPVDYVIVQQQFFLAPVPHYAVPVVAAASFFPLTRAMPVLSPGPHAGPVVQAVAHAAGREVRPLNIVDVSGPRGTAGTVSGGAVFAYRPRAAPVAGPQEVASGGQVSQRWSAGTRAAAAPARPQWSGSAQGVGVPPHDGWSPRPPVVQPSVGPHVAPLHTQPGPAPRGQVQQRWPQVRPYVGWVPQGAPSGMVRSAPRSVPAAAPMAHPRARQATQTR